MIRTLSGNEELLDNMMVDIRYRFVWMPGVDSRSIILKFCVLGSHQFLNCWDCIMEGWCTRLVFWEHLYIKLLGRYLDSLHLGFIHLLFSFEDVNQIIIITENVYFIIGYRFGVVYLLTFLQCVQPKVVPINK